MIDIVIATYKPNDYLREQIKSIMEQSSYFLVKNIIISMDDEEYNTLCLINDLRGICDKIVVYRNEGSKGVLGNFFYGFSKTSANYIMSCDQDDVWLKDKISISYDSLIELENAYGKYFPLLVGTDLRVVDENLDVIYDSFFSMRGYDSMNQNVTNLSFKNMVPGCTMIMNRALFNASIPCSKKAMMHDWWILLVAAYAGEYRILSDQTILYRQHSSNCLGAGMNRKDNIVKRLRNKLTYMQSVNNQLIDLNDHFNKKNIHLNDAKKNLLISLVKSISGCKIGHYMKFIRFYFNRI